MQEPMITEVVISVGDQDREGYPPPELAQVSCRGRGPFLDPSRELQVAALVTVAGLEHCHRAVVPWRSNRSTMRTLRSPTRINWESGTLIPASRARSSATFSHAITFQVSELALGNLAIAICPALSITCAFGRAPPSELPARSRRLRSS